MSKKTKTIIISCSIVLILLIISTIIAISPFTTVNNVISDKTSKLIGNNGFIYKQDKLVLSKFDLINPVYTRVFDISNDNKGEKLGFIYQLKRKNLFEFEVVEPVGSFSAKNLTFEEVVNFIAKNDLTQNNPDPANISVLDKRKEQVQEKKNLTEDEYYCTKIEGWNGSEKDLDQFKKVKTGMEYIEIEAIVGKPERGRRDEIYFAQYQLNNDYLIEMEFEKDRLIDKNTELLKISKINISNCQKESL